MYIVTAWNETTHTSIRSSELYITVESAREFIRLGMGVSIVRTTTAATVPLPELEEELARVMLRGDGGAKHNAPRALGGSGSF